MSLFTCAGHLHDALVGCCAACGAATRRLTCEACRGVPPLEWQLAGVVGFSAAPYAGVVGERVRRLKYHDETHWAGPLGRLLGVRMSPRIAPHVALVPVPLHPTRLAERGFNQAALVARAAARAGNWRVFTDVLARRRDTAHQVQKGADARRKNVENAFEVTRLPNVPVLLVDDVATTGSTLSECVLCLRRAGAIVQGVMTVALAGAEGHDGSRSPG